jgi:glucokinase
MMYKSIGIDIGGTNLRLGVFEDMRLVDELRVQADFSVICKSNPPIQAWQHILTITANAIQALQQKHPDIQSVGIGFPGFIDPNTHILAESPNLPGLKNVNLSADLSQRISLPVVVENDANAAAYGEYCLAGQPVGGLIYCGLGTGVGGGLVLNGAVFKGQQGMAMEIGHIITEPNGRQCGCGNQGCMEQYASASGVSLSYFNETHQRLTAHQIAQKARAGDAYAIAAFALAANHLAVALAHILKVVNVIHIVIGGGASQAWDLMQASFHQRLQHDLIPVMRQSITIQISNAGDQAGMLGAALLSSVSARMLDSSRL